MSQFYSELVSWTTAGLALAASLLNGVDFSAPRPEPAPDAEKVIAAAPVTAPAEPVRARVVLPAERELARPLPQASRVTFAARTTKTAPTAAIEATPGLAPRFGRVLGTRVNLRAGPDTSYPVLGQALGGDRLYLSGARDLEWVGVLVPGTEAEAWIHRDYFSLPLE